MEFVRANDARSGVERMAERLIADLSAGETLWLVCGGSSMPYAAEAMRTVREKSGDALARLTIALTDERYGPIEHADSNWRQLIDAGFDASGVRTIPILTGEPLGETVASYEKRIEEMLARSPRIVAQFGIGADGHIAGVLPHTEGVTSKKLVCGYEAGPYTRVTLTLSAIERVHSAYAFVFGPGKRDMLARLSEDVAPSDMPAQIFKRIPEAYLFSDQY